MESIKDKFNNLVKCLQESITPLTDKCRFIESQRNIFYYSKFSIDVNEYIQTFLFVRTLKENLFKKLIDITSQAANYCIIIPITQNGDKEKVLSLFSLCYIHYYSSFSYNTNNTFEQFYNNDLFLLATKCNIIIKNDGVFKNYAFIFYTNIKVELLNTAHVYNKIKLCFTFYNPKLISINKNNFNTLENKNDDESFQNKILTYLVAAKEHFVDMVLESNAKFIINKPEFRQKIIDLSEKVTVMGKEKFLQQLSNNNNINVNNKIVNNINNNENNNNNNSNISKINSSKSTNNSYFSFIFNNKSEKEISPLNININFNKHVNQNVNYINNTLLNNTNANINFGEKFDNNYDDEDNVNNCSNESIKMNFLYCDKNTFNINNKIENSNFSNISKINSNHDSDNEVPFYKKRLFAELIKCEVSPNLLNIINDISNKIDKKFLDNFINTKSHCRLEQIKEFMCYNIEISNEEIKKISEYKNLNEDLTFKFIVPAKEFYNKIIEFYFSLYDLMNLDVDLIYFILGKQGPYCKFINCIYYFVKLLSDQMFMVKENIQDQMKNILVNFTSQFSFLWDKTIKENGRKLNHFCLI